MEFTEKLSTVITEKLALAKFNISISENYQYLKPKQLQCLRDLVKCDTVLVLPTGYGKSLIFELLPYYFEHVHGFTTLTILIEPLNAIIEQEVTKLGDQAVHLTSEADLSHNYKYYIGHPEDILNNVHKLPQQVDSICVVIDESHCVLEWGEDFRPQYRMIGELRAHLTSSTFRMLACTATASKESQRAIATCLGMTDSQFINTAPVLNDNVTLNVLKRIPSVGTNNSVLEAYNFVYKPLVLELYQKKEHFPLTIVYCKLQWCAYGVELCKRLLGPDFHIGNSNSSPQSYCVAQYHSQQPKEV